MSAAGGMAAMWLLTLDTTALSGFGSGWGFAVEAMEIH